MRFPVMWFLLVGAASGILAAAATFFQLGDIAAPWLFGRCFGLQVLSSCNGIDGAFYLFPRVAFPGTGGLIDSFAFCKRLLLETKVGIAPGVAFGAGGEGSVRLCYVSARTTLEPALARFKQYLEGKHRP